MTDNRPRITQKKAVAFIPERKPFLASALTARVIPDGGLGPNESGWMTNESGDLDVFRAECYDIEYVVFSFATPIAWWSSKHGWYVVKERFSMITSTKHQSRLYMIPDNGWRTSRHTPRP